MDPKQDKGELEEFEKDRLKAARAIRSLLDIKTYVDKLRRTPYTRYE